MKSSHLAYPLLVICITLFITCTKDDPVEPINETPLVTPIGSPVGLQSSASIAGNGGTLSSSDGLLQITIPAGAVTGATTFSIQTITNECPGHFGAGYRLLPEGITFLAPVVLIFSYTDSLVTDEDFLRIAYQGQDQTWFAPKDITRQSASDKLIVETRHFSDWSLFERISISPLHAIVKIDESLDLKVILVGEPQHLDTTDADGIEFANLNMNRTFVSEWKINGTNGNSTHGYIAKQGEDKATYSAPSQVPSQNPVAVSAILKNVSFVDNGISYTNPNVIANILVIGKESKFSVDFTSSRSLQPVGNSWFTETDRGSMVILVQDDSVTITAIQNVDAEVTPETLTDPDPQCTFTLISVGDGPYHVSPNVTFAGFYQAITHSVYIGVSSQTFSTGLNPSFQENCQGSILLLGGEELPTLPAAFSFDATVDYQETVQPIPGGGAFPDGFLKTAVRKIY